MGLEIDGFQIIPEVSGDEIYIPRESHGRMSAYPVDSDIQYSSSECAWSAQCVEMQSFSYVLSHFLLWSCFVITLLYLLIWLVYYIIYKWKKDKNPLKHVVKKLRLGWLITMLLFPLLFFVITIISIKSI